MKFVLGVLFAHCSRRRHAHADDKLRVGKAVAGPFDFVPLDIGLQKGFFKAHGIDVEEVDFDGSAKLQQGLGADAIDVGLGSDRSSLSSPRAIPISPSRSSPGRRTAKCSSSAPMGRCMRVADLKGKTIGLSTVGSLTDWLVRELSRQQGWGPEGIEGVPLGSESGRTASLRTGTTDGMVIDVATAAKLEKEKIGRIVVHFGTVAPDFIIHAIFATNKSIADKPDVLKHFLAGWFETINWMRAHRDETVALAAPVMHQDKDIVAMNYDQTMNDFSTTGRFDPKALVVLARSFVEMKTLPAAARYGEALYGEVAALTV